MGAPAMADSAPLATGATACLRARARREMSACSSTPSSTCASLPKGCPQRPMRAPVSATTTAFRTVRKLPNNQGACGSTNRWHPGWRCAAVGRGLHRMERDGAEQSSVQH
eukprot:2956618-Prymnesium_polylepis.1